MAASGKYKAKFCDMIIEHMSEGLSKESFAGVIGVSPRTVSDWCHRYPEFAKAVAIGEGKSLCWWEKIGKAVMLGKPIKQPDGSTITVKAFQPAVYIFSMKARFAKYGWRDIPEDETKRIEDKSEMVSKLLQQLTLMIQDKACSQKNSSMTLDVASPQPVSPSGLLTE
jgi:hypothetical protein